MESITSAVEDKLIQPLDFKLKPGASYIQSRESVTFFASGSNIYTPENGTTLGLSFAEVGSNEIAIQIGLRRRLVVPSFV